MTRPRPRPIRVQSMVYAAGIVSFLGLSGCNSFADNAGQVREQKPVRQIVEHEGKKITVIDQTGRTTATGVALEKIDVVKDRRSMDWLDETHVLILKPNTALPPVEIEGEKRYYHNLYSHNLEDGTETILHQEKAQQDGAAVSPDGKYVFFRNSKEDVGLGHIMNLETKQSVQTGKSELFYTAGAWIDREHVIFSSLEGVIQQADLTGKTETLLNTGAEFGSIFNVSRRGDTVYYSASERVLYAYDLVRKQKEALMDNVVWAIPSPDGSRLAVVRRTGQSIMELSFSNTQGTTSKSLAKGMQIFGSSWSPDGTKLAFTITDETGENSGLYVAEADTGKVTRLALDVKYIADPIQWSPSGKRLLVSNSSFQENRNTFETYIVTLK
ncbi:TolB-like translocation protein [Paenibacillus swuensis]|uniref:PD40 domain-containing protein n=1 Tax=Paenibacillus swuensis TaxID=1178515 RepID=UPI000838D37C|nr:PD40 domain-containing protein [Paenibacillus swuensis]